MPTFTEDVDESLSVAAELSASEYSARLCSFLDIGDDPDYSKEWTHNETGLYIAGEVGDTSKGFNATSAITVTSTAANTVSWLELASSAIDVGESNAPGQTLDGTSAAVVTAAAAFDVATSDGSAISVAASASPSTSKTQSSSSDLEIEDSVEVVVEHDETSGISISQTVAIVRELDVVDIAQVSAAAAGGVTVVYAYSSDFTVSPSVTAQMSVVESVVSTFSVVDRAFITDVDYPALWANSERMATALWKQTPYESFVMHEGSLLAAGADGIYAFSASATEAAPIVARVRGDLSDMGSDRKKVFDSVAMAGTTSGPMRVTVETEMGSYSYVTHLPSATYPKTHRAPVGRGLTGRYVRFEIDNQATGSEGASFSMSDIAARVGDSERVR